jgi:hypothetical protein
MDNEKNRQGLERLSAMINCNGKPNATTMLSRLLLTSEGLSPWCVLIEFVLLRLCSMAAICHQINNSVAMCLDILRSSGHHTNSGIERIHFYIYKDASDSAAF